MRFALPVIRLARAVGRVALVTLAAVTAVAAQPFALQATVAAQDLGIKLGATPPDVALETLDGKPAKLSDYIGKQPVVFEFWATWCENCRELEPRLAAAVSRHGAQVKFVRVAVTVNQSRERVKGWQKLHPLAMDILYDTHGDASEAFDTPATSYVVVVNKAGRVVYTGLGGTQDLDAAIRKAM